MQNFIIERTQEYINAIADTINSKQKAVEEIFVSHGKEKTENWEKYDGSAWGGYDIWGWFKFEVTIPEELDGKTAVVEFKETARDSWARSETQMAAYVNGHIKCGIDSNHRLIYLSQKAKAGDKYVIEMRAYSGMQQNKTEIKPVLCMHNHNLQSLYFNLRAALVAAKMHPEDNDYRIKIENYLTATLNMIDLRLPGSEDYLNSCQAANEYMEKEFYGKYCGYREGGPIVGCVGSTHIDVAWLWNLEQTRQKAVRSFASVIDLMDRYPEYIFTSSQPQLYKFVKEEEPELYEKIKEKVKEGRWEVEGAMWLEADCNLSSGESLIRQILHGKRFIKEEFGKESKILWLPDVFGYSAALPQILKKSGIDTFVTSKISWNEYNTIPYDTFNWQGIDGTEIFTQFIIGAHPNVSLEKVERFSTYSASIQPLTLEYSWRKYHQKDINNEILTSYGYGDGGGGANEEMLEFQRRTAKSIPGSPTSRLTKAADCIARIKENVKGKKLPKWVGELYLEMHRGTYTSMAKNKKFNRMCEHLLAHTETVSLINKELTGGKYPKESLYNSWEKVLLNQFHDIIPGSSIKEVYEDSDRDYAQVISENTNLSRDAISNIAENVCEKGVLVYNPTSFERSEEVEFDGKRIFAENIPAYGYKVVKDNLLAEDISISENRIENDYYILEIDEKGAFSRIFDKKNSREMLKPGERGNVIYAYDDHPFKFDNWEMCAYYPEQKWEVGDVVSTEICGNSLKITKKFMNSTICQSITVYGNTPRIDIKNDIDWNEHHIILRSLFPVDIDAGKATFEIQYGAVERPTHMNTSWEAAKFEVCAHKWMDYSENGYGVALLNDCKYGCDIHDGVMGLTLLKCGTYPNENADIGKHEFTYSLMAHSGSWQEGGVVKEAFALNCPLIAAKSEGKGNLPANYSFISSSVENVIISAVKEAQDGEDIIVRAYEACGRRTNVKIETGFDIKSVSESDFVEAEEFAQIKADGNTFEVTMKPYEIKTFRIKRA